MLTLQDDMKQNGKYVITKVDENKNPTKDDVQNNRIGFDKTDDTDVNNRISNLASAFANSQKQKTVSGRRKRQSK